MRLCPYNNVNFMSTQKSFKLGSFVCDATKIIYDGWFQ